MSQAADNLVYCMFNEISIRELILLGRIKNNYEFNVIESDRFHIAYLITTELIIWHKTTDTFTITEKGLEGYEVWLEKESK